MIDPSKYKVYYLSGNANKKLIELDGINNLSVNKNISFEPSFSLGGIQSSSSINAPQEIELTFDRTYTQKDHLINFTGNNFIEDFFILNGTQYYRLTNLYLKNYSVGFSVGEIPKINVSFVSFGGNITLMDQVPYSDFYQLKSELDIPKLGSIFVSGINNNNTFKQEFNIFSFDYSINVNRQPYYSVGSLIPTEVSQILPLEISTSINSKLPNSSKNAEMAKDIYLNYTNFDIIISGTSSMFSLPFRNGKLINTSIQLASQNTIEVKNNYLGYYGL